MSRPAIRVQGLSKQYGVSAVRGLTSRLRRLLGGREADGRPDKLWALQDLSFELGRGETIGVIGRNGAGKSTLLKLLCGVTTPTRGTIDVRGRTAPLIEVGAGFHPELSGRENVYFNAAIMGMTSAEIRRKYDAIVAFSGLERFMDVPVKKYSSGMFVRLGFSVAVHTEPDILLVDEVLSVGDAGFQHKCFQAIRGLLARGCSLVLVSHSMTSVQAVCRRVVWLDQGRAQMDGPADDVIRAYCEASDRAALAQQNAGADTAAAEPARIERLVIRDDKGRETDTVRSRRPMELEIHYVARERVRRPMIWVGICHSQFGALAGLSNTAERDRTPYIEGRGVMRVRVPDLPLMPGVYQLTGGIRDETQAVPLTSTRVLGTFQVVMTAPGHIGDVPHRASQVYGYAPVLIPFEWLGGDGKQERPGRTGLEANGLGIPPGPVTPVSSGPDCGPCDLSL